MKKSKKLIAYFCAFACAATMLTPLSQAQAETESSSWKNIELADPFEGATAKNLASSTSTETTYKVPIYSTYDSYSKATPLSITGTLTPNTTLSYTITLAKDASLDGIFVPLVDEGSVYASLTDANGNLITNAYGSNETCDFAKSFVSAGTYTLTIEPHSATGTFTVMFAGVDASKSGTIKVGTAYVGYNNSTTYKKFTVSGNKCIGVMACEPGDNYTSGKYVTICNSKKKAISAKSYTSNTDNYVKYYGLKKGTYYLKLSSPGFYYINTKNYGSGTISASSKKKAKTIKSSFKNYIIPASTSKSSGWFKYTFKKSAKKTLTVRYVGDYSVNATIYKGSKAVATRTLYNGTEWTVKYQDPISRKETSWQKGTYYVKIQKMKKTDSGYIKIKMK